MAEGVWPYHEPSHLYNAGKEHVGISPGKQIHIACTKRGGVINWVSATLLTESSMQGVVMAPYDTRTAVRSRYSYEYT